MCARSLDKPSSSGGYTGLLVNGGDDDDEEEAARIAHVDVSWHTSDENATAARRSAGYNQHVDDDLNVGAVGTRVCITNCQIGNRSDLHEGRLFSR
jgi:hypothetical protein